MPRAELRPALEGGEASPGPDKSLLNSILRIMKRTKHPVAVHMQFPVVRLGDMTEGLIVAGLGRNDQTFDRLNRPDRCLGHGPSVPGF